MGPSIKRALGEGFRAAARSWAGLGFFAGALLLVLIVSLIAIVSTRPPARQFPTPEESLAVPQTPATAPSPTTSAAPPAAPTPEAAPPSPSGDVNLFNQLETTQPPAASEPVAPAAAAPASETAPPAPALPAVNAAQARADEQERAMREWLGRAWPVIAVALLFMLAANVWLSGGQIAYLNAQLGHPPAKLSVFWQEGTRAFGRLLGAEALSMLAGAVLVLLLALAMGALSPLPPAVRNVFGFLMLAVLLVVGVWLVVRLSFWFITVVVDGVGPVAGLKASWRATRGRWLKTAGLGLLVGFLSFGVSLVFRLIEWLGSLIGGSAAVMLGAAGALAGLVASLYVGFVALAAFVQFYRDAKGSATASTA